jgi:hypothetical protein
MKPKGKLVKEWQSILESRGHLVSRATKTKDYHLHTMDSSGSSYLWLIAAASSSTLRFSPEELERLKKLEMLGRRYSLKAFIAAKFLGRPSGYLVSTPGRVLRHGQLSREGSELLTYFYCPACLTQYDLYLSELEGAPHCGHCGAALEREG